MKFVHMCINCNRICSGQFYSKHTRMKVVAILAGLLCCSVGTLGDTFYSCRWITSDRVNCDRFSADPTCGSDLKTYRNKCEFSRAHCTDSSLALRHYGACTSADGTTPKPVNVNGGDVVFDFMCTNLSHMDCPVGGEIVCASDGRNYENYCEYEKEKCTHRDLSVGTCSSTSP